MSLLGNGEIQTWHRQGERKRKPGAMKPIALGEQEKKATMGRIRWLAAECEEGRAT